MASMASAMALSALMIENVEICKLCSPDILCNHMNGRVFNGEICSQWVCRHRSGQDYMM